MANAALDEDVGVDDAKKQLFKRIQSGETEMVLQILRMSPVLVNCQDEHGMTPLQNAAFKGNIAMCELLLAHGADVNATHHENGYTTLMFAALSGNTDVTRLVLEAGAKRSPTNSVGRTAAQMAAFVGQHACVSIINNFFDKDDLDYYTKPTGFEKEPKLPPALTPSLYKMILIHNLSPVKLVLYLWKNENLLNEAYKVSKVLDMICEKQMKSSSTNDVLAVKMHYIAEVVRECHKWNMEKQNGVSEFMKFLLRARESDGVRVNSEKMLREIIRQFPYHDSELFLQIVRNLSDVKIGDEPTALSIFTQAINGARSAETENCCNTCGQTTAPKTCSACKVVKYCDHECQKLEWFTHKKQCKRLSNQQKEREITLVKEKAQVEDEGAKETDKKGDDMYGDDKEEIVTPENIVLEEVMENLAETSVE